MFKTFLTILICLPGFLCIGQDNGEWVSPEVQSDRSVTFRFGAPDAKEVIVYTQFTGEDHAMEKGEGGIWSITLGPSDPGIYEYNFKVDGIEMSDPRNRHVLVNYRPTRSIVEIPGDEPMFYDQRPVPHGQVHIHWFESITLEANRRIYVYTPPGYEKSKKKYPVVYLMPGGGGYEHGWTEYGRVNLVMDNLIADEKAEPMIIVMPDGHIPQIPGKNYSFEDHFLNDLMPYVDNNYRIADGCKNHAMAGTSMGGSKTLYYGVRHLDKFCALGVFGMGIFDLEQYEKSHGEYLDRVNEELDQFWLACGKDDFLFEYYKQTIEYLKERDIRFTELTTEGGHTYINFRHYFYEFAQSLFK